MVTTWKIERVYSPVLDAAVAIGKKARSGNQSSRQHWKGSVRHACPAACSRL